jgi:hypothetical protein
VWAAALAGALVLTGAARGQADETVGEADAALESYLDRLGLKSLLAEQLEDRLTRTPTARRGPIVERLGRLYVELLSAARDEQLRADLQRRGEALLALAPEADSFELRLNLLKAVYLRAEERAERVRLRLAEADAAGAAEAELRALADQFGEVAAKVNRRVETLERAEAQPDAGERVAVELGEARRLRSLAHYYAGWANVYVATLAAGRGGGGEAGSGGGAGGAAVEALRSFGWLVGAPTRGSSATVDRLQPAMLRYEHIARSAVGCAMAASLRGNDTEALRWLDAVAGADGTPEPVRAMLDSRRLIVLAAAGRWQDADALVRRMRRGEVQAAPGGVGGSVKPLEPGVARLLAVLTLEADRRTSAETVERLSRIALGDLVAARQTAQVMDLVDRYGTAALGEAGFIVNFVRGVRAYEDARAGHGASPGASSPAPGTAADQARALEEPATDAAVINQYRAAADLLAGALRQDDAPEFAAERSRAMILRGRALFFAGQLLPAADAFTAAFEAAGRAEGEEALWLAVLSLDRARRAQGAEASGAADQRLAAASALFLATYPDSERGARLVLMQTQSGAIDDEESLRVLLSVEKSSPIYAPARRQAARLLYNRFRTASAGERDFEAQRFIGVGEEVLAIERALAMRTGSGEAGAESVAAAERYALRARQLLDALLSVSAPDPARAAALLTALRSVAAYNSLDLSGVEPELLLREAQIRLAQGELARAAETIDRLAAAGEGAKTLAAAGERAVFRAAQARLKAGRDDAAEAARLMTVYGVRLIDRLGSPSAALAEPAGVGLYSAVAGAAFERWKATGEIAARDLAVRLDKELLLRSPRLEPALRRLGVTAEAAGDAGVALSCWRTLLEATPVQTPGWWEATYQTIRVMALVDAARARAALEDHRALHPDLGPEEWRGRFQDLDSRLPKPAPADGASPPAGPGPSGEGGAS